MATDNSPQITTLPAAADYSAKQYCLAVVDSSGNAALLASQGADADGVIYNDPDAAGKELQLAYGGVVKVKYGDTITAGNKLTSGADGRAEVAASGDHVIGKALVAGVDGDVGSMLVVSKHILA
jgi:hypothetical protein